MLQSAVTPSKAIQLYQCIVVGFWSVAFNWFLFSFPNFRVPFISIEKEKDRLDCGAEASVVRPIRSSCGFIGGGVDFCGGFGQGFFFSWVARGWRNRYIQVLLKPEGCFCFGGKGNIRLTFPVFNGMFQERIQIWFPNASCRHLHLCRPCRDCFLLYYTEGNVRVFSAALQGCYWL